MPLLSLHLLQLRSKTTAENYVQRLLSTEPSVEVVVASKPRYLVIRPTKQDVTHLADTSYDLMILARAPNETLPESLRSDIQREYKVVVGIPSKLLSSYPQRNRKLLAESSSAGLTGSLDSPIVPESSQNLELSPQLLEFMKKMEHRPVTMLNLLHFNSGGKPSYYQYGQNFIKVAGKRGGDAKIVGNVVAPSSTNSNPNAITATADTWQEIAIVHYPSITHFCDMLAGKDYQAINEKYRLPALADTVLLCTTEMDLNALGQRAKL